MKKVLPKDENFQILKDQSNLSIARVSFEILSNLLI